MKNNILKFKIGFTLIETLVAISILTAAIAGPLVMSIKNIGTASTSQDQLVAFYLGQEVIEYVRNVRDSNLIGKNLDDTNFDWLMGLGYCKTNGCYIDVDVSDEDIPVTDCGSGGCVNELKFDGRNYGYSGDEKSSFTRQVQIKEIDSTDDGVDNPDEAQIDVTMTWTSRYGKDKLKTMKLQDHIFNWRE